MTVRRSIATFLLVVAMLLGAGCGGGGNSVTVDETTDSLYQQGLELKKEGRSGEALIAFLHEIDRRGESGAPESHLEAATLYLNSSHEPFDAYYHFSKFLELRPNDKRADDVRGQRDAARREVAKLLQAPPLDQNGQAQTNDEIEQLRRQVQELQAENLTLRGGSAVAVNRPPMIALADHPAPVPVATANTDDSPLTPAPTPPPPDAGFTRGFSGASASAQQQPARTVEHPAAPSRPVSSVKPAAPSSGRRTHTVAQHDSLWIIARRYYGAHPTGAQVDAIYEANRDVMKSKGDLHPGMVLKIP